MNNECEDYDAPEMETLTIPDSVTKIGYYAFAYCLNLRKVNLPDSVSSLGERAFEGCESLKEIRKETFGKRAAYAYSAGKDSIVLADLCEKAGISRGYFAYCDLDYPEVISWVRENKPAGVVMMRTGYGLDWLYQHQNLMQLLYMVQ